jgi:flagellar biosynthetic protein FliS
MNIQQQYREATVQGASPVALVVRLYEQLIEDLRQVAMAIEQNDIARRTTRINHAILVVGHLQSPLDFANGGKVAKDLNHFYDVLRQNLVQVQFFPSQRGVAQLITDLLAVREAWIKVEQAESPGPPLASASRRGPSVAADPDPDRVYADWQG